MPLWSRIALVAAVLVLSAVGMASTLQAFIGRRAVLEQARSGALGIADVLARAAAFAEEVPAAVEAEIGEQMLTQARLVAQLVAVAETAGLSRDEILSRLRNVAGRSGMSLVASDETGLAVYQTDAVAGEFRFSKDPTLQPQAHVFHRLLDGDLPSVVQDARKREIDDLVYKYVGAAGRPGRSGSDLLRATRSRPGAAANGGRSGWRRRPRGADPRFQDAVAGLRSRQRQWNGHRYPDPARQRR